MRSRPVRRDTFIDEASPDPVAPTTASYTRRSRWPVDDKPIAPRMEKGGTFRKHINLPLKEYEWNSIDRHTKDLGVSKSDWIRYALFKQMEEEQIFFGKDLLGK